MNAILSKDREVIKQYLTQEKFSFDINGNDLVINYGFLHEAIRLGDDVTVKLLLEKGADVTSKNGARESIFGEPLLKCPEEKKSEIFHLLIQRVKVKKYTGFIKDICLTYWKAINDIDSQKNLKIIELLCNDKLLQHTGIYPDILAAVLSQTGHNRDWVREAFDLVITTMRKNFIEPPKLTIVSAANLTS